MKLSVWIAGGMLLCSALMSCSEKTSKNYYFDAEKGNDQNDGTSPERAFKSLSFIQKLSLKPGDSVLLKSGEVFNDTLFISCKGDSARPIVLGKYGGEARPFIKADGLQPQAVHVFNSEHFVIRDLELSNTSAKPADKINGLLVELYNYGKGKDIVIDNLFVHDVKGELKDKDKGGGKAISLSNYRDNKTDKKSSHFDGVLVQNCIIKDC